MDLKRLLNQDKLKPHRTSPEEINDLVKLVKRDIEDARVPGLSADRKFATAYNAILQSVVIMLYCQGYKTQGIGHHFTLFEAMKEILGREYHALADYFDTCRAKRNITDYTCAGEISHAESEELIKEAKKFLKTVLKWLKVNHPNLLTGR